MVYKTLSCLMSPDFIFITKRIARSLNMVVKSKITKNLKLVETDIFDFPQTFYWVKWKSILLSR